MSIDSTGCTDDVNYVWNNTEWDFIPEPILLKILTQLPVRDILNVSESCKRYNDISKDDYLWKKVFRRDFKVDKSIPLKPGEFGSPINMKIMLLICAVHDKKIHDLSIFTTKCCDTSTVLHKMNCKDKKMSNQLIY